MIFLFLNICLTVALLWFSLTVDFTFLKNRSKYFINMLLVQIASAVISVLCILFFRFDMHGLLTTSIKIFLWLPSVQAVLIFMWSLRFTREKNNPLDFLLEIPLLLCSFYIVFFLVTRVNLTSKSLIIFSLPILYTNIDWYGLYRLLYTFILPLITVCILFFKYELSTSRFLRQRMLFFIGALCIGELLYAGIRLATTVSLYYGFIFLVPFVQAFVLYLLYKIQFINTLFSFLSFLRTAGSFYLFYIVPALPGAVIFALLLPLASKNKVLFFLLTAVSAVILVFLFYILRRVMSRFENQSESDYAERLEKELASLNFTDADIQIEQRFAQILKQNLDIANVIILTENNENKLITRYSLDSTQSEFDIDDTLFSSVINMKFRVIFKTHCETVYALSPVASKLTALFDQTNTEVMILLNEGSHLFALILLGKKNMERSYTDFDFEMLNSLYSHFFLIGYYLKNIANEALVGTVGREIRFSEEVIQSLRKNTDAFVQDGYDADSFSLSARSLGGEFTDFIKLDNRRYMIVIGDLSGKGLAASMSMAILKSIIRTLLAETRDFKELVQKVNIFIKQNLPKGTYFSGMFCLLDTSMRTLYYANCALPALFMYNKTYNSMVEIQGQGKVLGFVDDITNLIKVKKVQLAAGDMLVAVSDGVIGAKSVRGEQFGKNRIQQVVLENMQYSAEKICSFLGEAVKAFTVNELEDDVSAVVLKIL
ncbi:MAG: PP2C family protein-serine/threonine phosphatase [Treponema lecithinolyticum]|uniref:PP2C family protein-serine/threonine phosphatase n=2 Tax=Treponema lecithinolyticum TaxID=53418 RepID=UPI0036DF933A